MSRSGYSEDCDGLNLYRGAVESAIRGKRGQAFLRELVETLDAMPVKRLITSELELGGEVCALGSVGKRRGLALNDVDPYEGEEVAAKFGIAPALAREIMWENDEGTWSWPKETPEQRWIRMRDWAVRNLSVKQGGPDAE